MKLSAMEAVLKLNRLVFTTYEVAAMCGSSVATTSQCLGRLESRGIVKKIKQGLWGMVNDQRFSPFLIISFLNLHHRSYLSFLSALHAYGVISQIPQIITVASTAHSKKVKTPVGVFEIHQISPDFFDGFDWHKGNDYLLAMPEKALADCLYVATRKLKQYAYFPELELDKLNKKLIVSWIEKVKDVRIRRVMRDRLEELFAKN